jgi:hypothetical protein
MITSIPWKAFGDTVMKGLLVGSIIYIGLLLLVPQAAEALNQTIFFPLFDWIVSFITGYITGVLGI